ncbi:hypothetical protein [Helicobacter sp. 23-1045]
MKKILISAVAAGALLGQLSAFEVLKDGEKSLEVIGMAKAVVGYGYNFSKATGTKLQRGTYPSEFIYGIQGNSRIGLKASYGNVFGAAILGAGEATLYGDKSNTGGFRNLYLGYDFGDAGKILAGKNELVTTMGGFSSSIFDTESGLQGFGGTSTSTRRFQVAYMFDGVTVAVSENDVSDIDKLGNKSVPRFSVGYDYSADGLTAKVAASYTYASRKATAHIAYFAAGAKYDLGGSYVSGLINYGLNSQLVGESKINNPSLSRGYGNVAVADEKDFKLGGTSNNTHLVGVALEYGMNINDDLGLKVGAGYQYATKATKAEAKVGTGILNSYSAFVQLPYNVGKGFSIIPQVGYLGTTTSSKADNKTTYTNKGNVLAEVLFNLVF